MLSGKDNRTATSVRVLDGNGTQVYPQIIDRFGNYWSSDANGNLVDDVGRTPVIATVNGNVTYYDVLAPNGAINNNGTRVRYTVTASAVTVLTGFNQSAVSEWAGTFYPVQSIQLPDGTSYSFTYDSYGEMTSVTLPAGGVITYGWSNFQDSYNNKNRWLTSRAVGSDPATTFTPSVLTYCSSGGTGCQEKMLVHKPNGDETAYELTLAKGSWNTKVSAYNGSANGTPIRTVVNCFTFQCNGTSTDYIMKYSSETTLDNGLKTLQRIQYDQPWTGKPKSIMEWDYYTGTPSTTPNHETDYTYSGFDLLKATVLSNGIQANQTTYGYTSSATAISGLSQHGSANAGGPYLQTVTDGGTGLSTSYSFDNAGTVLSTTDSNGTTTYGHDSSDTFVTLATPPTPSSGVSLSASSSFDFNSGVQTSATDANSQTTDLNHFDTAGRSIEIDYPDGGKTQFNYQDSNNISTWRYQTTSTHSEEVDQVDSFGRNSRVAIWNGQAPNSWYQNDFCYDTNGRLAFQPTTYQGSGWGTAKQCSGTGISYSYDGLDRVLSTSNPDGTVSYQYTGRAVKSTDVTGVQKITQSDIWGRPTAVCELTSQPLANGDSPSACGLDISGTGFTTTYEYDDLNHKTTIYQGNLTRTFQTDSLGRMISTSEPERGETTYSYSYNSIGLQVTRTRPRANQGTASVKTHTTTQYDSLGRVGLITYDDGTPNKGFWYDQANAWGGNVSLGPSKGYLTEHIVNASGNWMGAAYGYDSMGRVNWSDQCQPSGCGVAQYDKFITYSYDYLGNMKSSSDPASSMIYTYNPASQVTSVTNTLYGALVPNVQNGPFGPAAWSLGNGVNGIKGYDAMGRNNEFGYCTNGSSVTTCNADLNATVLHTWMNARGNTVQWRCDTVIGTCHNFLYDDLGRMSKSQSFGADTFTFSYDRYGNRTSETPASGVSGPSTSYGFTARNQISAFAYDAAGNLINDAVHSYTYDAEGNVTQVDGGASATYYYDALNQRIRTEVGGNVREFVYDLSGRRVSIWDGNTHSQLQKQFYLNGSPLAFYQGGQLHYQHQDWLGTERVRTGSTGAVEGSYQSLPFGDGFTSSGTDLDAYHFAGIDRDAEIDTQHAQFRQYSSTQGRWMAPDPYDGSYDMSDPQSFNRYSYVGNKPLSFIDPDGLAPEGGASNPMGGCAGSLIGVAATGEAGLPEAGAVCAAAFMYNWVRGLFGALGGPSFNGSLQPRPSTGIWDEQGSFHAKPYSSIASMIGDVGGLNTGGCEFGMCGDITNGFQAGAATAPGSWCLQHPKICTAGIELADILEKVPPIAASVLLLNMKGDGTAKPDELTCKRIVEAAKAACTNELYGGNSNGHGQDGPTKWRNCVRAKVAPTGCSF